MTDSQKIISCSELLKQSRRTVALTGAGISTPSGIPDFRSPGTGIWEKVDPAEVASIDSFLKNPKKVFDFMEPLLNTILNASPNPAHAALAQLEERGMLSAVVTQNIDGLHQKAGSKKVIELHGNLREAVCFSCRKMVDFEAFVSAYKNLPAKAFLPACSSCGGFLKPNVIFFGEELPKHAIYEAFGLMERADLVLVAGSSLTVSPASMLPQIALQKDAKMIIVNLQPTYIDEQAQFVFHEPVDEILPRIVRMAIEN